MRSIAPGKDLAAAFGHVGIRVKSLAELDDAMSDVFGAKHKDDLVFVDAHVDPEEHVYPMSIKGGSLKDMILERSPA